MITFHGKGAHKARQSFEGKQGDHLTILTEHQGAVQVLIVTHYKHLGGFITKSGSKFQEIRIRAAATMAKLKPLRKLLKSPVLAIEKKRLILQSMGVSVLTLHSGTWFNLTQSEFAAWQAGVFRTYQMIQPRQADGQVPHTQFYKLASEAGLPMPMELLYIQRLKLLFHVMGVQDRFMINGILENHEVDDQCSWLYGAMKSIKWMRSQVGNFVVPEELDELQDVVTWDLFAPHAKKLQQYLKKVQKAHLYKIRALCAVKDHSIRQNEILSDMGWTFDAPNAELDEGEAHRCDVCDDVFDTPAALAVHQQKRHGLRIAMRRFAIDSCCRACGRWYHTRSRLLRHLHVGNTECWVWHCRRYIPMTVEEAEEKDKEDRKKGVAMHQKGFADVEVDKMWRPCTEVELMDRLQCKDDVVESSEQVTESELKQWSQFGMLPPGRGGRMKTSRRATEMHMFNVNRDIAMLENTMLKEVGRWSPDFSWVPRPLSCGNRYFLVFFSGHRRFADIAQQLSWKSNIIPICVDLAVDPWHGNILRDTLWLQLIRARKVAGAHAGPPARLIPLPVGLKWKEVGQGHCGLLQSLGERMSSPSRRSNRSSLVPSSCFKRSTCCFWCFYMVAAFHWSTPKARVEKMASGPSGTLLLSNNYCCVRKYGGWISFRALWASPFRSLLRCLQADWRSLPRCCSTITSPIGGHLTDWVGKKKTASSGRQRRRKPTLLCCVRLWWKLIFFLLRPSHVIMRSRNLRGCVKPCKRWLNHLIPTAWTTRVPLWEQIIGDVLSTASNCIAPVTSHQVLFLVK